MKKIVLKILGIVLVSILVLQYNIVIAASQKELDAVNNQIEEKKDELEDVKSEKSQAMSEVEKISNQIADYQTQIDELDNQINELNTKITDAENKINEQQSEYEKQEKLLEERLVVIQEAGDTTYLDMLLTSKSITDFISNYYLASELAEADTQLLENIQKQKEEIENAKTELETSKKDLDTKKASKQSVATQLQSAKNEKSAKVAKLSEDEKSLQAEIDELQAHEASIKADMEKMKNEFDKNNNNSTSSFGFGWPVSNNRIGTGYGVSGKYWSSGYHTGVDFPVGSGTPVYAVGDGQVFDTGYNSAYGNYVEIYHGNNVYSFYAHASRVNVSKGQKVTKGQQIMLSGATGNVTGAHLHFEIRSPGYGYSSCVNPMKYLP